MEVTVAESNLPAKSFMRDSRGVPTPSRRVSELIARLLSHYWTADDHPAMRQAQAEDWIEDLVELPTECVEEACREWRQTQTRRPVPSEIRILAITAQARMRDRSILALPAPELSDEEILKAITARFGPGWDRCYFGDRLMSEPRTGRYCAAAILAATHAVPKKAAAERKPPTYEDPDALRRGRVALGLEDDLPEER
jgi:hypothetical protein